MRLEMRKSLMQHFPTNRGSAIFSFLLVTAFILVVANVMFYQPGKHPQPLWKPDAGLVTHMVSKQVKNSVPVRKVETISYSAQKIPIPVLRPSNINPRQAQVETASRQNPANTADIQRLLRQMGFYQGTVDGLMGPQTLLAVKKFERSKGLPENGNISPSLLLLLQSAVDRATAKSKDSISSILEEENSLTTKMKLAADNNDRSDPAMITRIQVGLINYGSDKVIIDGVMDRQTKIAIEQFQTRFNLEVDGTPSRALIRKLESVGALTRG